MMEFVYPHTHLVAGVDEVGRGPLVGAVVTAAVILDPAKPILEKVSRGFLKDGRVFEYSRNVFNTDDYKFTLVARRRQ